MTAITFSCVSSGEPARLPGSKPMTAKKNEYGKETCTENSREKSGREISKGRGENKKVCSVHAQNCLNANLLNKTHNNQMKLCSAGPVITKHRNPRMKDVGSNVRVDSCSLNERSNILVQTLQLPWFARSFSKPVK